MTNPAIILLNEKGLETAKRIQRLYPEAIIWGLEGRASSADKSFTQTGEHLRQLYGSGITIIGLCATGILIRALSPALNSKHNEPAVLAVSDDGALVVPLLGGLTGANEMALELARTLGATPAITASGARHYAIQLEAPPDNYSLANPGDAKRITSDILAGATVTLDGECSWLEDSKLPFTGNGDITLRISAFNEDLPQHGLLYHPKSLLLEIDTPHTTLEDVKTAFDETGFAPAALAAIITSEFGPVGSAKQIAANLDVPLRLVENYTTLKIARRTSLKAPAINGQLSLIELKSPPDVTFLGRPVGRISVVGLGPGKESWRTPEVKQALEAADCLVGYQTYIDMVPTRFMQRRLPSDNRVELERAMEALDIAARGNHVAIVSSGDPGIFAMASAVLEAIDKNPGKWAHIDLEILPGLSAMQGAAALTGAPLGHDFAVISLSDIRKPFEIIEQRLIAAANSDMVIAIYNPASKTRRQQVERMKKTLCEIKAPETPVLIAKNIGRPGEERRITTLGALDTDLIDMRTMLIIGSSKTRVIKGPDGQPLIYTPRSYE